MTIVINSIKRLKPFWFVPICLLLATLACDLPGRIREDIEEITWYVSVEGDDSNSCRSESEACRTIRAAVNKASGGIILIAAGRYRENEIVIDDENLIFNGAGQNATVIDGDGNAIFLVGLDDEDLDEEDVFISDMSIYDGASAIEVGTAQVTLTNVTFETGFRLGDSPMFSIRGTLNLNGVTVRNSVKRVDDTRASNEICATFVNQDSGSAVLDIRDSMIEGNEGVAICNRSGFVRIWNTTVSHNTGGGINNVSGEASIRNSVFSYNGFDAISNLRGTLEMTNCLIEQSQGNGIINEGGEARVANSTIDGHIAHGIRNVGGATLTVYASTILHSGRALGIHPPPPNSEKAAGIFNVGEAGRAIGPLVNVIQSQILFNDVGIINGNGTLNVSQSSITENALDGIVIEGDSFVSITNTTISGNGVSNPTTGRSPFDIEWGSAGIVISERREYLGALYRPGSFAPRVNISGATIAFNPVGIDTFDRAASVRFRNTIVASNPANCRVGDSVSFISDGYNLTGGFGPCAFHQDNDLYRVDLLLQPLVDDGSGTKTHAILPDSPVHDAGICTDTFETLLVVDQRGQPRPSGDECDIGAYEISVPRSLSLGGTDLPELATITPVPSASATSASTAPFATFTKNANCRRGPETTYAVVTSLLAGQEVLIEGRNDSYSWWWILLPESTAHCWVSDLTVDIDGPVADVPLVAAPPPPTATKTHHPPTPTHTPQPPPPTPTPTATLKPSPPAAPGKLAIADRVCNAQEYSVTLGWIDNADNENGYRVYRGKNLIATLKPNATNYEDNPPGSGPYTYGVEAFNGAGASERPVVNEEGCLF